MSKKGGSRVEPLSNEDIIFFKNTRSDLVRLSNPDSDYLSILNISYSLVNNIFNYYQLAPNAGMDELLPSLEHTFKRIYKMRINNSKRRVLDLYQSILDSLIRVIDNPLKNASDELNLKFTCVVHIYSSLKLIINKYQD